ncbi:hypothetical protein SORBI_3010G117450, partial [Sorghum bicolor]
MAAPLPQSQPPTLMDELVEEILLRLPSDEAAQLVCAALVCKHWCRLVTDPGFRCRFRQFLRTPSRLGLIIRRLSPATTTPPSFPPLPPSCLMPATTLSLPWTLGMAIPSSTTTPSGAYWNATLLYGTPGCNHMECPSDGPFTVVLVGGYVFSMFTHAYVYSSEADDALVTNTLYFPLRCNSGILEYDLAKEELSVIGLSTICKVSTVVVLMLVEDDGLGFAMVHDDFSLYIWLRESAPTPS